MLCKISFARRHMKISFIFKGGNVLPMLDLISSVGFVFNGMNSTGTNSHVFYIYSKWVG